MPADEESKLSEYREAGKAWASTARIRAGEWAGAVREEPALIWQTAAVRYSVYGLLALIAVMIISWFIGLFGPGEVIPQARTADFHVVCTSCGHHYVINRKFGFDDFPVKCAKCDQETGEHGIRCVGGPNDGKWVAAKLNDDGVLVGEACDAKPAVADDEEIPPE